MIHPYLNALRQLCGLAGQKRPADDTEHLLSSPRNAERLFASIACLARAKVRP